jgi:hypothetical protein
MHLHTYIYLHSLPRSLNQNLVLSFVLVEKSMETGAQQQKGVHHVYWFNTITTCSYYNNWNKLFG